MDKEALYWKTRCEYAERYIEESPCDPDITLEQVEAFKDFTPVPKENIKLSEEQH